MDNLPEDLLFIVVQHLHVHDQPRWLNRRWCKLLRRYDELFTEWRHFDKMAITQDIDVRGYDIDDASLVRPSVIEMIRVHGLGAQFRPDRRPTWYDTYPFYLSLQRVNMRKLERMRHERDL